ncbi:hypothetical protein DINM_003551 [Dirofilaria immitis]|nr:hypothetical protein [Dirofilaria immitis]
MTISIPSCPCIQQPVPIQQNRYATSFISSNKVSSFYVSPPSYSVPYSSYSYSLANIAPYARIPYSQPYNSRYTYNAPQSFPQQSYVPQAVPSYVPQIVPSYVPQASSPPPPPPSYYPEVSSNIIPTPGIYNPPGTISQANIPTPEIYNPPGITPQAASNNTPAPEIYNPPGIILQTTIPTPEIYNPPGIILQATSNNTPAPKIYNPPGIIPQESLPSIETETTPIYEPQKSEEYGENLQQIEVKPANINSELINNAYQENTEYGSDNSDTTLPAQNVALVPTTLPSEIVDNLVPYQSEMTTVETYTNNDNAGNHNQVIIPIAGREKSFKECITLLNLLASNTDVQKIETNNTMDGHALNDNNLRANLNVDNRIGNEPSTRNGTRPLNIHRAKSIKKLKSSNGLITDNQTITIQQGNGDKIVGYGKNQNSKIGKNNIEKYNSQMMRSIFGKEIFKKVSSNDKLFDRTFGRSNQLNNEMRRDEDNYYITYYHQICTGQILVHLRNGTIISTLLKCNELDCDAMNVRISGNRILEITLLKKSLDDSEIMATIVFQV